MKEQFINKKFAKATYEVIDWCNKILAQYKALGYDLTTRQVYYQLVAQDKIPNNPKSYNRIKRIVSEGRMAGFIDWEMIVDRTRKVIIPPHWENPADMVKEAAEQFAIDKWENQPTYIEVMVEKEALAGILEPVCKDLDIPFTANKGYSSDSALYRAGKRMMKKYHLEDKVVYVLYLGDHDPSGMDMDRHIYDRLGLYGSMPLDVERLALLMKQIETMDVPENPAKTTDSQSAGYIALFGESSWELDAIEPTELARIVTDAVEALRDEEVWQADVEREEEMRDELQEFADNYGGGE